MTEDSDDGNPADGDYSELARLQQRTWAAAAPYLAAAVVAWVGAGIADYRLNNTFSLGQSDNPRILRQTLLQISSQVLLFAGLGLFAVGLLVVVLRQHDQWRRDCGRWLGDDVDMVDMAEGPTEP